MTTDHFEFKAVETDAKGDSDHKDWIDIMSMGGGATSDDDHKGWSDLLSMSPPIYHEAECKHGDVCDWSDIAGF